MLEPPGVRILYIEDDVANASLLRQKLQQAGYEVDVTKNSDEALVMCQTTNYDIVVVDQSVLVQQSLETIHLLVTPDSMPPTIVVTSSGHEKVAIKALKMGASGYVIRDVDDGEYPDLLTAVIEQVLKQRRLAHKSVQAEEEIKKNIAQIKQAKQEWESTVDSLSQFVGLLDNQGRIIRTNRTVERWGLAAVTEVRNRELHTLFHPNCDDPTCYLKSHWTQVWESVAQGQPAEFEAEDKRLQRYFLVQVRPMSTETIWQDEISASFAVVVIDDITERKEVEAEREKLIEELDAFAHTVAHDLQNPLGPVIGFADILHKHCDTMPFDQLKESLFVIARNALKMSNIINELLLLAGVRKRDVRLHPLTMRSIVVEAQHRLIELIEEYQAEIISPDRWPVAQGYGPWVEEVWVNYISNAIKYGGRPPRVELGATEQEDGMVRFWVRDNGRGLTPEEQSRLFTPFTQLSQVQTKGYGLGLSIVERIIEKLGGQVAVESMGVPGEGSIFSFTLPSENKK